MHTYIYTRTVLLCFPCHLFKADQLKGSDLKCYSQVVVSCPVNMYQMITSSPQAEGWKISGPHLLTNLGTSVLLPLNTKSAAL